MRANIPIHADVTCSEGDAGTSKAVIVDPMRRRVTHIVVRERGLADSERLVPMDLVDETSEDEISLRCTRDGLHRLDNFIEAHFVNLTYATPSLAGLSHEPQPYPLVISKRIPKGEIALGRLAVVEATDGSIGHVKSLVVDTDDDHITHVVVLTHHFLSRQEVAVPADEVEKFFSDYVLLRIGRRAIEGLPHVPFHEAFLLPALTPPDRDLVPEDPADAGVDDSELGPSRIEAAHLLAGETGARLRARGFTDEQILDWAKAFLRAEHSGGDAEFLDWISKQEQASNAR